jgi:starch-binding outer membrane protein, SusD/RagB family
MQLPIKKYKYLNSGYFRLLIGLQFILLMTGCKKLLESEPPSDFINGANVYTTDAAAIAVLNGIYISMNEDAQPFQGRFSISLLAGLDVDELTLYSGAANPIYRGHYTNSLSETQSNQSSGGEHWSRLYRFIFKCNAAIEGLEKSNSLTPRVQQQLLGESKFLRAFMYFYLVNLFGDVPLVLTTDPEINQNLARSPRSDVYQQIIADLLEAEEKLNSDYLNEALSGSTLERVRPTKWAAIALLARVYLYNGEWIKSEEKASLVINNNLFTLMPLNEVFLKNSKEAIWQIQPTDINFNTLEAQCIVIPETGPNANLNAVYMSDTLLNSFEPDDLRAKNGNWVDIRIYSLPSSLMDTVAYSNKYKLNLFDLNITSASGSANMAEYFMVLRLGEQYLIRSEALAQQGKINEALGYLNTIRTRAFSPSKPVIAFNKEALIAAILHERQVELFMEFGHRWFDLKRTGEINELMQGIKPLKANGSQWESYQQYYPLPFLSDLQRTSNLVQNEGY